MCNRLGYHGCVFHTGVAPLALDVQDLEPVLVPMLRWQIPLSWTRPGAERPWLWQGSLVSNYRSLAVE